jgi:hypothetical protein
MAINLLMSIFLVGALFVFQSCKASDTNPDTTADSLQEQINTRFYNEIAPENSLPCFQGAYYRKAVSSTDNWLGIEGKVILPSLFYDSTRTNPLKPGQFLDNASIYLGSTSDGQETDIGMTWEVIKDNAGNVSKDRKAFRPFLRRSAHKSGQTAIYKNAPAESIYYWYPGDTITLAVQLIEAGKLKFTVTGSGRNYEEIFDVAGCQYTIKAQYKRVNAIDQVSNEGKPVQPTKAKAVGAKWLNVNLFRNYKSDALKVPMHTKRFTDMRCPDIGNFNVNTLVNIPSGESVDIFGAGNQ